ncbi:patatin-like phospholipase family protein [Paenibacillus macquariensis]|uniref:Predicted phospholipase, patatin/cPLA2 family n=1 Tax=Paenibacillus macquariensis TaxID=948756 RepID=A0ABY1JXY8_9BACL|nr:patatin family protein [Paenibacillus macquariensis]MEC0089202.1 patatin family protein [Paenibacillus macquariensis]OAB33380.1 patatin family protein [Paenibacillus macquariensis subsp. macquariensis]SIQ96539.1 Predicted phospholipase, patatin/cPLA2 family [Paenibacillus macquariensis]
MPSLILEGGTLRPIFSAGVMDALLDQEVMFPYCIGVSAGISNGFSYISKQTRRNLDILEKYRHDKRYIGVRNFLRSRSLFGLDFIFREIPNMLLPFNTETFHKYTGQLIVGVTNAHSGKPEYMNGLEIDDHWTMLRATCALPLFFPAIEMNGTKYYDGGLSDPIPIRKAITDGNDKHLIVLTQPKGYVKPISKENAMVGKLLKRKYPNLEEILLTRHVKYNETVAFCEQLEKDGQAIILRPMQSLNSFEKNLNTLKDSYQHGYDMAKEHINSIQKLFL